MDVELRPGESSWLRFMLRRSENWRRIDAAAQHPKPARPLNFKPS
jgi:hypothetical protein